MIFRYALVDNKKLTTLKENNKAFEAEISRAKKMIEQIYRGEFDENSASDEHSTSLLNDLQEVRQKLKKMALDEQNRNWAITGALEFNTLTRKYINSETLNDEIVKFIVQRMGANQGGLYMINETSEKTKFIELVACYAYQKKRKIEQRIEIGQGLIGQTFLEQTTTYLTEIPDGYIRITSGLGDATPRTILIVPLLAEEQCLGIVEIASFNLFQPHQIEFLEKLAETVASVIFVAKANEKTNVLLKSSVALTQSLNEQQEELKQNKEEMEATLEEMARKNKEIENLLSESKHKEEELKQAQEMSRAIIDGFPDPTILVNNVYTITYSNPAARIFEYEDDELLGQPLSLLLSFARFERYKEGVKKREKATKKSKETIMTEVVFTQIKINGAVSYLFVIRNIDNELKKEQELIATVEKLEAFKSDITKSQHNS